jgi:hypothetical protein
MELFEQAGDFWRAARVRVALGAALGGDERYPDALANLWQAVTDLRSCGDATGARVACTQLEIVYRDAGLTMNIRRRRRLQAIACP